MKKLFYFAAAAVALAACAKNEVIPVNSGENQEITFNVAPKTKAATKFADNLKFKSYAYYLPSGQIWDNHPTTAPVPYIVDEEIAYRRKTADGTDMVWKAEDSYYWPKNGSLTFFAWTSLNETNANNATPSYETNYVTGVECSVADGIKVTDYDVTTNKNVDFLVADIVKDKTSNSDKKYWNEGVTTIFKHKLSYVIFKVNTLKDYSTDGKKFTLNYIKFNKIEHKGTYKQLPTDSEGWTIETSDKTEQTYIGTDKVFGYVDPESGIPALTTDATQNYYLPQTFGTSEELEIKYTITTTTKTGTGTTASDDVVIKKIVLNPASVDGVTPPSLFTKWERGKKYTVTLTFSLDEIFWDPAVENWEEVSAPTSGLTTI